MLNIKIICIGKLKEQYLKEAIKEYEKRLKIYCRFSIIELNEYKIKANPSDSEIEIALKEEGKEILSKISPSALVIPLCIEGKKLSSLEFSKYIEQSMTKGFSEINFIIGGSFGLCDSVKNRSDFKLSMSDMTFPHQLARVMLSEQIYRVFQILNGGKYHK